MKKRILSMLLAAIMLLTLVPMSAFAESPAPANTGAEVYRPYDLTLTMDSIIFKEDVNVSDCVIRWDMFILAGNSGETAPIRVDINEFDAEGFKLYEGYCIKANGDSEVSGYPGATFKKLDDDTFEITIIPSKINGVKFLDADNPYIWLVVAPGDAYNRLDQSKGTSGHYDVYNSTVCLGKFGSMENFKKVNASTAYAITNGTPESAKETNHGYIAIDKASATEGETVTITVNPAEGYQLKSLTAVPEAKTISTVADVLATVEGGFPQGTGNMKETAENAWVCGSDRYTFVIQSGQNSALIFYYSEYVEPSSGEKTGNATPVLTTTEVIAGENCYTATFNTTTLTFNMTDGKLTGIVFSCTNENMQSYYGGTYTSSAITPAEPETIIPEKQTDGTYQFTMPGYAVIVTAEFELEEEPTSPQTGDNSHMTLWVMLLALSSMGLCACLVLGKKRKNEQ